MFVVRWVVRDKESEPILIEKGFLTTLDKVVLSCKRRIAMLRLEYPATPPDGFIVMDSDGIELRRWFRSLDPDA